MSNMRDRWASDFGAFSRVLSTIGGRHFDRQLRSEECGCCTLGIAKGILPAVFELEISDWRRILELLFHTYSFQKLPRFTLRTIEHGVNLLGNQADDYQRRGFTDKLPPAHRHLCEAIKTLAHEGKKLYDENKYLLFCRIAVPLLSVRSEYKELYNKPILAKVESALGDIDKMEILCSQLQMIQQSHTDFTEDKKTPNQDDRRRLKRVWSGGISEVKPAFTEAKEATQIKVVDYNREKMAVYSSYPLKEKVIYKGDVSFNYIDIPFSVLFEVDTTATVSFQEFIKKSGREKFLNTHGIPFYYVVTFKNETPSPQYYFLSLCRDLICQNAKLQLEVFSELFLWDYGIDSMLSMNV